MLAITFNIVINYYYCSHYHLMTGSQQPPPDYGFPDSILHAILYLAGRIAV